MNPDRPEWWPTCPYPEDVFPMTDKEYVKAVPDPKLRTAISGFLMREGWRVAEGQVYDAMCEHHPDEGE